MVNYPTGKALGYYCEQVSAADKTTPAFPAKGLIIMSFLSWLEKLFRENTRDKIYVRFQELGIISELAPRGCQEEMIDPDVGPSLEVWPETPILPKPSFS